MLAFVELFAEYLHISSRGLHAIIQLHVYLLKTNPFLLHLTDLEFLLK